MRRANPPVDTEHTGLVERPVLVSEQGESSSVGREVGSSLERETTPSGDKDSAEQQQKKQQKEVKEEKEVASARDSLRRVSILSSSSSSPPSHFNPPLNHTSYLSTHREKCPCETITTSASSAAARRSFWVRWALAAPQPLSSAAWWIARILAMTPSTRFCI